MTDELARRLDEIFFRYSALDNADFLLSTNLGRIRALADAYKTDMAGFLFSVMDTGTVSRAVESAARAYASALAAQIQNGTLFKKYLDRRGLIESLLETWRAQADSIAANQAGNLYAKGAQFKTLAVAAEIPAQRIADIAAQALPSVNIAGTAYNYAALSTLWERMNDTYGQRDTVQFRNGVNYPLRSYVDGRTITTEAETHRAATIIEASADGLWFGTTNKTGTTDSCIYHEGEIFFLSDAARDEARQKYGDAPEIANMRTWFEIVSDRTHMGKFNCKHIIRPATIQFRSNARALEIIRERQPDPVPKKIDERKVFELATGRKWQPETVKQTRPNYAPISPQGERPQAYTIA
jgi:hypothetical protein